MTTEGIKNEVGLEECLNALERFLVTSQSYPLYSHSEFGFSHGLLFHGAPSEIRWEQQWCLYGADELDLAIQELLNIDDRVSLGEIVAKLSS